MAILIARGPFRASNSTEYDQANEDPPEAYGSASPQSVLL